MKIEKIITKINYLLHLISFDKHKPIRSKILKKSKVSKFYNYNSLFFYQSLSKINLRGLRDSKFRIKELNLVKFIKDKDILDIGTNIGAILFEIDNIYKSSTGIDYNKNLIDIGNTLKKYLDNKKIKLICSNFLTYNFKKKFDIILSLANHSTFDNGINDPKLYFKKINMLLKKGGVLFFEGHHPKYLDDYDEVLDNYLKKYKIIKSGIYKPSNYFDTGRKFAILKKIK